MIEHTILEYARPHDGIGPRRRLYIGARMPALSMSGVSDEEIDLYTLEATSR